MDIIKLFCAGRRMASLHLLKASQQPQMNLDG